jgi:hypothetical protein
LSFNRTQSRVILGVLVGHNTLRRHFYLLGLLDSPLCWGCGVKEETSAHILCECEALASLRHMCLSSFLEPEDIKSIGMGAIFCSFGKAPVILIWGTKGPLIRPRCIGAVRSCTQCNQSINQWDVGFRTTL